MLWKSRDLLSHASPVSISSVLVALLLCAWGLSTLFEREVPIFNTNQASKRGSYNKHGTLTPHPALVPQAILGDTPSQNQSRKAVVISSYRALDTSWLEHIPSDWEIYRYVVDEPHPPSSPHLTIPRNYGREAMTYLTFIIDFYNNLPDYVVFIHGHRRAWHQQEPILAKLRALNLSALSSSKYISLRCNSSPGDCQKSPGSKTLPLNDWPELRYISEFWETIFPPLKLSERLQQFSYNVSIGDPRLTGRLPNTVKGKCCAQFAVTKDAIQSMHESLWRSIREPLLKSSKEYSWSRDMKRPGNGVGLLFEEVWHILFGTGAEYCPDDDLCRRVHFSGAITCDHYITWQKHQSDPETTVCESVFPEDEI